MPAPHPISNIISTIIVEVVAAAKMKATSRPKKMVSQNSSFALNLHEKLQYLRGMTISVKDQHPEVHVVF